MDARDQPRTTESTRTAPGPAQPGEAYARVPSAPPAPGGSSATNQAYSPLRPPGAYRPIPPYPPPPLPGAAYPRSGPGRSQPDYPLPLRELWAPPPLLPTQPISRSTSLLLPLLGALVALALPVTLVLQVMHAPPSLTRGPYAVEPPNPMPVPTPDHGPVPRFEPRECTTEFQVARTIECGDLVVLEDRAQPGGRRIRLRVAIQYESSRRAEQNVPILYLDGGPGGSPLQDGFMGYLLAQRGKVVVLDQRGVGMSDPSLVCHEFRLLLLRADVDAAHDCRERLTEAGVNLAAYTTAASAADVEELRVALGITRWDLYGVSYGTRLALAVMRDYPAGVRSAILDSAYPPGADIYADGARNAQRAFDKLFAACTADAECNSAYPDLGPRFYSLLDRLNERPTTSRGGLLDLQEFAIDGSLVVQYLREQMYSTWLLGALPGTIDAFTRDEWMALSDWYWSFGAFGPHRPAGSILISEGMYLSVQCAEAIPFLDRARLGAVEMGVRVPVALAFDWRFMVDYCEVWDVPAADARSTSPVDSDVPALLLAGAYDPVTPPEWAAAAAEHLHAAHVVVAAGVGHGVLESSWCIDEIVREFLDEPTDRGLDTSCAADLAEPAFWVYDESWPD